MKFRLIAICAVILLGSCSLAARPPVTANGHPLNLPLWEAAHAASIKAEAVSDKQEKAKIAKEGISYAEECIMKMPEEAACYYYRAINTGIYYSAHAVGYQEGLKTMINDCKKVIELNDKFDHGGAYRTIGKIYTEAPETTFTKNGITKDIDLAISYLEKAVVVDPDYPENHIYLADAYSEAERKDDAMKSLTVAIGLTSRWKNHHDYASWQKMNKELSNKLK